MFHDYEPPKSRVPERCWHGVIFDFIKKLQVNANEPEVLGDGTQSKSYLHETEQQTNVLTIARIVAQAMGPQKVAIRTTAGAGGRAWPGDVRIMQLNIGKMKQHGWEPKLTSDEAVRRASEELVRELEPRINNQ